MAREDADFMLWLGDNWYYGAEDLESKAGMKARVEYVRNANVMRRLAEKPFPEYAVWDDHDYGPNNSDRHFALKQAAREIFTETWPDNPSYGDGQNGIYTTFRHEDVKFILLDDRWWRSSEKLWDYRWFLIPNKKKLMWGSQQMKWLKDELSKDTTSTFSIIFNGSQILNPLDRSEGLVHYPVEYKELLDFVADSVKQPVIFLTGDRHFSEIIRLERKTKLMFDITVSPLSSSSVKPRLRERRNRYREPGTLVTTGNYARISVTGPRTARKLQVDYLDHRGRRLVSWEIIPVDGAGQ